MSGCLEFGRLDSFDCHESFEMGCYGSLDSFESSKVFCFGCLDRFDSFDGCFLGVWTVFKFLRWLILYVCTVMTVLTV